MQNLAILKKAKQLGIRVTKKIRGKRVYKTVVELKKQIATQEKQLKKLQTKAKKLNIRITKTVYGKRVYKTIAELKKQLTNRRFQFGMPTPSQSTRHKTAEALRQEVARQEAADRKAELTTQRTAKFNECMDWGPQIDANLEHLRRAAPNMEGLVGERFNPRLTSQAPGTGSIPLNVSIVGRIDAGADVSTSGHDRNSSMFNEYVLRSLDGTWKIHCTNQGAESKFKLIQRAGSNVHATIFRDNWKPPNPRTGARGDPRRTHFGVHSYERPRDKAGQYSETITPHERHLRFWGVKYEEECWKASQDGPPWPAKPGGGWAHADAGWAWLQILLDQDEVQDPLSHEPFTQHSLIKFWYRICNQQETIGRGGLTPQVTPNQWKQYAIEADRRRALLRPAPAPAPAPAPVPSLPAGWASVVDSESGRTYYFHEKTRQTQWDHPDGSGSGSS